VRIDDFHKDLEAVVRADLLALPVLPPIAEKGVLRVEKLFLGGGKLIKGIELVLVGRVAFEDHQFLVVKDEVRSFVKG
jgi:hypothetical protein